MPTAAELPGSGEPELPVPTCVLKCREPGNPFGPEQTFYVLGTAHVSSASCQDVEKLIRAVQPQIVMLELCPERRQMLSMSKADLASNKDLWKLWRKGDAPLVTCMYSWQLSQVGDSMKVLPGEEFRVALREAQVMGAKVVLGDRPVHVTIARLWAALSMYEKTKFLWQMLISGLLPDPKGISETVESLKETDVLTEAIREMGQQFPTMIRPLINERDQYMVWTMRRLACHASRVVAVVGAGHLPGIREHWDADIHVEDLMILPQQSMASRVWNGTATLSICGLAVGAAIYLVRSYRR